MAVIDGKNIAKQRLDSLAMDIQWMIHSGQRPPCLAAIIVGDDPASEIYVAHKIKACHAVGIRSIQEVLPASCTEADLLSVIQALNQDSAVDGILLQLPLPTSMDAQVMLEAISPFKDVDGFHPYNAGRLLQRRPLMRSCTPYGVMKLLESTGCLLAGKHAVVVGCSNIVGKPMAIELLSAGCTVTICHRLTEHLEEYIRQADILVVAVGKPSLIRGEWIKQGSVVIDVGITRLPTGKIVGDIDFESAEKKAAWITPVPGGVGPMTIAMLLENTLIAAKRRHHEQNV